MAVPKQKMSRSRTRSRKAQWRLTPPRTVVCPECGAPHLPHRICHECGSYKGREVVPEA